MPRSTAQERGNGPADAAQRQMTSIRGVLFDHDGTLVNSLAAVVEATNRALTKHGYAPQVPEVIITGMAMPTTPRMGSHAGVTDSIRQQQLAHAFISEARSLEGSWSSIYPGVQDLIVQLRQRQIPLAMISNNDGRFVRAAMRTLGLFDHFQAIYGDEDMPAPKPDPRGVLIAAGVIQRDPATCIYVGDSQCDAQVAHAAGMRAVGVTWGIHTRAQLERMGFDWLIDAPAQLLGIIGPQPVG